MKVEVYKGEQGNFNLKDYQTTYDQFDWKEVEKVFSCMKLAKSIWPMNVLIATLKMGKQTKSR